MLPFFPLMVRLHVICIQPAESGVRVHSRISQDCENQWRQTHHGHVCLEGGRQQNPATKLHRCPKVGVTLNFYGHGYGSEAMAPLVRTESLPPRHCRRLQKHNILSEQHFSQQNAYFRNLRRGRAI